MNKISLLGSIVGLVVFGAAAPAAFGLTGTNAYIESYRGRTDIPVPVKIVSPDADSSLVGAKVEVEFLVDAAGRPQNIQVIAATDRDFGVSVCNAVKRWEFSPARPAGAPVPMKVMLPVVVSSSD